MSWFSPGARSGRHGGHPEVVGVGPEHLDDLAKARLDLEAVTVEGNDVERV
jgi:hypothetical protein